MIKERQSNFELLRIIAIFMIICFHYALKGGWSFETGTVNQFILKVFLIFGELGVNLFMLITGYFMIDTTRRWKQVLLIVIESVFYTLLTIMILYHYGQYKFETIDSYLRIVFPDVFTTYWYVTAYLIIYILSPYINIMLNTMDKNTFKEFVATALFFWCIIPSIFQFQFGTTETGFYYTRLIWLTVVYSLGAYIKKYGLSFINSIRKSLISAGISFCCMLLTIYITENNPVLFGNIINHKPFFWAPNTVLMVILSVSLFNVFSLLHVKQNHYLNLVAGTTLGVYIIHDGKCNHLIWTWIKENINVSNFYPINIILGGITVLIIGVCIDLCRKSIEKKIFKNLKKDCVNK